MNTCASYPQGAMFGMSIGGKWGGFFSDFIRVPNADITLFVLPPGINPSYVASLSDNIPFGYELTVPHLTRNCGADVLIMGGTVLSDYLRLLMQRLVGLGPSTMLTQTKCG